MEKQVRIPLMELTFLYLVPSRFNTTFIVQLSVHDLLHQVNHTDHRRDWQLENEQKTGTTISNKQL